VIHQIPLERANLQGQFSRDFEPVLSVDPGDSVRIAVPNAGWHLELDRPMWPRERLEGLGHALASPIEVRGARAG
jgi:acetamidase/formamidase